MWSRFFRALQIDARHQKQQISQARHDDDDDDDDDKKNDMKTETDWRVFHVHNDVIENYCVALFKN
jgi:hypothetical protein